MQSHPSAALALASPASPAIRNADDLAAAFLAGYGRSTREAYARDLRDWASFLDRVGLEPLAARRVHVDAYCRESEATCAHSTLARRLAARAGFYAYAVDEGLIDRSPVARVRRPIVSDASPRLGLDRDELTRLLAAAMPKPRDHALVCLLALNGLRVSEALAADVGDLSCERGHRTLALTRKGGKRQTTPLAPRTSGAIDALAGDRESGPLFVTRSGRRLDRHAAGKVIARPARRAGINKATPHSLRHAFVTAALDSGASLRDVQDAAGHADPRTTRRYDRGRHSLDRHPTYGVAAYIAA